MNFLLQHVGLVSVDGIRLRMDPYYFQKLDPLPDPDPQHAEKLDPEWRSRLRMELWRVCRPEVADSHHFEKGQNSDPDPN